MKFVFVLAWLSLVHAMGKEDGFALQCKSVAKCIYRTKGECDKKWPSASSGTVYMYKSEEHYKGNVYNRFFHVFVAKGIKNQSAPLVIYLHGGYVNGLAAMGNYRLDIKGVLV